MIKPWRSYFRHFNQLNFLKASGVNQKQLAVSEESYSYTLVLIYEWQESQHGCMGMFSLLVESVSWSCFQNCPQIQFQKILEV